MDSTLFVITQLTELIKLFGNIKVRYEFKKEPIVHLIEFIQKRSINQMKIISLGKVNCMISLQNNTL